MLTLQRYIAWTSPIAFIAAAWLLLLRPSRLHHILPKHHVSREKVWDPALVSGTLARHLPTSKNAAWQLGHWAAEVEQLLIQHKTTSEHVTADQEIRTILQQSAATLHLPEGFPLTSQHLIALGQLLQNQEQGGSAISSYLGLLSLANVIWCVAILGICVTVGPAAYVMFKPAVVYILRLLRVVWAAVASTVIYMAKLLLPVYAWLGFYACLVLLASAHRFSAASQPWIALTAHGLATIPALYCIYFRDAQEWAYGQELPLGRPAVAHAAHIATPFYLGPSFLLNGFSFASIVPTAVLLQSQLLGFMAAAALFSALGFTVFPFFAGWCIGWMDTPSMLSTAATSALLLLAMGTLRTLGTSPHWLQPFRLGAAVMGAVCMYLAGLIMSSASYYRRGSRAYALTNAVYFLVILVGAAAGMMLQMGGLSNTALTFCALWLGEKVAELAWEKSPWVAMFAGFAVLWRASLFLSEHPEWLASMLRL